MKKNYKSSIKIINKISSIRSKNNKNWMDLYRLAFEVKPEKAVKIIKRILLKDRTVTKLAQKLLK